MLITPCISDSIFTLLFLVPDSIVKQVLWPKMNNSAFLSLLWKLRCINKFWTKFIASTLEYQAFEILRLDYPRYLVILANCSWNHASLIKRLKTKNSCLFFLQYINLAKFFKSIPSQCQSSDLTCFKFYTLICKEDQALYYTKL